MAKPTEEETKQAFEHGILTYLLDTPGTNAETAVRATAKRLATAHGLTEADALALGYRVYAKQVERGSLMARFVRSGKA